MIEFRDRLCRELGLRLIVHTNTDAIEMGADPFRLGTTKCCALLKTKALLDALKKHGIDAAIGGARRDEEKSRAKERIFSFRDAFGQWDPKSQRPELWNLYNYRLDKDQSLSRIRQVPKAILDSRQFINVFVRYAMRESAVAYCE